MEMLTDAGDLHPLSHPAPSERRMLTTALSFPSSPFRPPVNSVEYYYKGRARGAHTNEKETQGRGTT